MIVYRIRRKSDGLFSMGGTWPRFNKTGKVWKRKGDLSSHLGLVTEGRGGNERMRQAYADCEIVCYEMTETESDVITLDDWLTEKEERKAAEERRRQERRDAAATERRRAEYEKLRLEFEPRPGEVLTLTTDA